MKLCERKIVPQIIAIHFGSLAFLSAGIQYAWTSPYIPYVTSDDFPIKISFEEASYFTVIPPIAAIIFAPVFSKLADLIGRKYVLLLSGPVHFSAYLLIYFGESTIPFYVSRFLTGFGDAVIWSSLPIYVGEISEPYVRGSWGNVPGIILYLGQLFINVIAPFVTLKQSTIICAVVPLVFSCVFPFMPESPYYLLSKGKYDEAYANFTKLRNGRVNEEEFKSLKFEVDQQLSEKSSFKDLFCVQSNRKALLIAIGTRAANQFSGIGAFTVYCQYLFEEAGQNISKELSSILFMTVVLILATSSAFYQDTFGRRPLMIVSCLGCAIVLLIEAIYFYLDQETAINMTSFKWTPLVGMMVYVLCFSSGLSLIPTLLMTELFSTSVKGNATLVTNIFFNGFICAVTKIFQALSYNFGLYVPFLLFSLCCFCNTVFCYFFLIETRGKTLEEIQRALKEK